ncbi:MAG: hypothetical protein FE78DRAFT_82752 [Acidomyces sp. 'richmondensis']|nr:MAG: hypothetical protein FE78DRAFT_82752 [Acidomyces sp. 'richmondensis']
MSRDTSTWLKAQRCTATPTDQTSLPRPFDSSLGNNFTSPSCPEFFHSFLTNSSFKDCLPLSMLLQTSNSFFSAEKSPVRLSQTLAATCNVNFTICSNVMASLAEQIQWQSNCGQDFQYQNPVVLQAYNALIAYPPLYHAGCLTDSDGNYCFANAVTNKSAPTGAYIYYLPLGVELPAGTQPTCDKCLQNTMTIFATAAGNSSLPLSKDYTSAAQTVDSECGPAFVESSIAHTSPAATLACPSALIAFIPLIIGIVNFLI